LTPQPERSLPGRLDGRKRAALRRHASRQSQPFSGEVMLRVLARLGLVISVVGASPAFAFSDPTSRGPLADFLNLFRQQAVPRELVGWSRADKPGTVVVSTSRRRLYYVLGGGRAIQYGVGVGRQGFTWSGTKTVTMKREWPDWRPPPQMLRRRPDLPRYMPGGIENPLGARAIYLG